MNHQLNYIFSPIVFVGLLLCGNLVSAQSDVPVEMKDAIKQINEESVTKTIKFLSSDEMAGRDTPSPQLAKAEEFVAERFKKAGLTGGAGEGKFLQPAEIAIVDHQFEKIVFKRNGTDVKTFGLMSAGKEAFSYTGKIEVVDPKSDDLKLSGPVALKVPKFKDRREQFMFMRSMNSLTGKGATAIVLLADSNNSLAGIAKKNAQPQMIRTSRRNPKHVLVVPADTNMDGEFKIELPVVKNGKTTVHNVVAVLKGSDAELSKQAILVTAHLDHIGTTPGLKDPIFNGADDNATGVTGVLTMADAFGVMKTRPKRSVIFMTFWGEEKGLLGAKYFCNKPTWPLEDIVAMVNLEMIGRPEPGAHEKAWMTGWDKSDLGKIMAEGSKQLGIEVFEHPQNSARLYGASDNFPFAMKGVVAHSFSAGSLHSDYHQPGDEWEKLNLKHMTRVIQGLYAGVNHLAKGDVTPKKTKLP